MRAPYGAVRLRINRLLAPALETAEKSREIKSAESERKPEAKSGAARSGKTPGTQPETERGRGASKPQAKAIAAKQDRRRA